MTRTKLILAVLATAFVSAAATLLALRVFSDEPPIEGAVATTIRSSILGEDREYFVHLPESYEASPAERFPVMYVLDGTSQSGHTAAAAALMARIGVTPEIIVVGVPSIDGDTRNRDYTPPDMRLDTDDATSPNGAADRFLAHLETELVPAVESHYRTARPRMLAGWSRGGLFVIFSQIEAPATFDARFAHSPALWRENDLIVGRLERALSASTVDAGFLFLSLGDGENEKMTGAFHATVEVLRRLAPATLRWRAHLSVGGKHESNPLLSTPVGLCAVFNLDKTCGVRSPGDRVGSK